MLINRVAAQGRLGCLQLVEKRVQVSEAVALPAMVDFRKDLTPAHLPE
jgi:hypothetical protein